MKIAVMGSKDFKNKELVIRILSKELSRLESEVIIGGTEGIYGITKEYCKTKEIPYEIIYPINNEDISHLCKNVEIITKAEKILIFWDRTSRGTKFVIDYAKTRSKLMQVYDENGLIKEF